MKSICIYCGSREGADPVYRECAGELGRLLASRDIGLVYGGARCGLMGVVADAVLSSGGRVTGVIPEKLLPTVHSGLQELIVTATMAERKQHFLDLSDGVIALPGGVGTLEEISEAATGLMLGYHRKPCAIWNVGGYYDELIAWFDKCVGSDFLKPQHRAMIIDGKDPVELLDRMAAFHWTEIPKWELGLEK